MKDGNEIYGSKVLAFNKFTLSMREMLATFDAIERKQQFRRSFSQGVSQPLPRYFNQQKLKAARGEGRKLRTETEAMRSRTHNVLIIYADSIIPPFLPAIAT